VSSDDVWSAPENTGKAGSGTAGQATTYAMWMSVFNALMARSLGGFLVAYVLLAGASFLMQIPNTLVNYQVQQSLLGDPTAAMGMLGIQLAWSVVAMVLGLVIGVIQGGLFGVMHSMVHKPDSAPDSVGAVFRATTSTFVRVLIMMLVAGVITTIGVVLCVLPGVVAAFVLAPAVYLAASRPDPIMELVQRSVDLVRANLGLCLLFVGGLMALMLVAVVVMAGVTVAFPDELLVTNVVVPLAWGLLYAIIGYPILLLSGSLYISMDAAWDGIRIDLAE